MGYAGSVTPSAPAPRSSWLTRRQTAIGGRNGGRSCPLPPPTGVVLNIFVVRNCPVRSVCRQFPRRIACAGKIAGSPRSSPVKHSLQAAAAKGNASLGVCKPDYEPPSEKQRVGADFSTLWRRFLKVAAPYWSSEDKIQARWRLAGVLALTLGTTGISVAFNFLGRDFYNALASKDQEQFVKQLLYYLGAFVGGIPVFVIRDYSREKLSLRWRAWMTKSYMDTYFKNQTFYNIQSQSLVDNPDQRMVDDVNSFTSTSLIFALALFNAAIDLISFSGILYGIYPPLFAVLVVYSIGGTALSVALGKGLVGLNFMQEKREADFRYGLVRVRENAESIAFYGGEGSEIQLLLERFKQSLANYSQLLVASRNLDFFTSAYRYLIQLLPAAVVAPLFFAGKIEFGVINQSFSAFNHILSDFSIIVYQFQSISAFSAVVDRLGEFNEILEQQDAFLNPAIFPATAAENSMPSDNGSLSRPRITVLNVKESDFYINGRPNGYKLDLPPLLEIDSLTLQTPQYTSTLVEDLSFVVNQGEHLLIMGASGTGKTSLLRSIAGLWTAGKGTIKRHVRSDIDGENNGSARSSSDLEGSQLDAMGVSGQSSERKVTSNGSGEVNPPPESRDGSWKGAAGSPTLESHDRSQQIFFLPQRPYMVLGSLRQQILYPTWTEQYVSILESSDTQTGKDASQFEIKDSKKASESDRSQPSDEELMEVLEQVSLGHLLEGCDGLDAAVEWSSVLSLGEQQRLAFARLLVSKPKLALLDESTSALDEDNEIHLYEEIKKAGITYVSVGHRSTLRKFHQNILRFSLSKGDRKGCDWTFGSIAPLPDLEAKNSPSKP